MQGMFVLLYRFITVVVLSIPAQQPLRACSCSCPHGYRCPGVCVSRQQNNTTRERIRHSTPLRSGRHCWKGCVGCCLIVIYQNQSVIAQINQFLRTVLYNKQQLRLNMYSLIISTRWIHTDCTIYLGSSRRNRV